MCAEDTDDDIVMPEGPPPGMSKEEEEEDTDDDIPMPEGPPPGSARKLYADPLASRSLMWCR